jgi:predicted GIY-YIG superfamily endonuclease
MSYYVYLIRSIKYPQTTYVGYTVNIKERLATHNSGGSIHTKKDRPWELVICMAFKDMDCAKQFEKYLKSQSGRPVSLNDFFSIYFVFSPYKHL